MLREVALRRAIEDARARRARELEEVVERQGSLRRRLRELQDRLLALGTVHGRFAGPEAKGAPVGTLLESEAPRAPPTTVSVAPTPSEVATAADVRLFLAAPKPEAETHGALLAALASRHPDGFTVSQMREIMDLEDAARAHSYDAAWSLANTLLRSQALELAGTRPGPAGQPIRVYRVPHAASTTAEVR